MKEIRISKSRILLFLGVFALVAFILYGVDLPGSRVTVRGLQTMSLNNVRSVGIACQAFAEDHDGNYPAHLGELEPDYLPNLNELRAAVFVNPKKDSGLRVDWLYFGAGFTEEHPPTLLLASPQAFDRKDRKNRTRIFAFSDTSCRIGLESEYQSALAKTMQETQALLERAGVVATASATPAHNR